MKLGRFGAGIILGLWQAFQTDIDVFLLGLVAFLLSLPWRLARALAKSLLVYTIFRRMDNYVAALRPRSLFGEHGE